MHRGFTIDTWDYVSDDQQRFGRIASLWSTWARASSASFTATIPTSLPQCRQPSRDAQAAGRATEAPSLRALPRLLKSASTSYRWNGKFYTHWIAENPDYKPDVGVDMSNQVSSPTPIRSIAVSPTKSALPSSRPINVFVAKCLRRSPGEFYGIYPPFQKDFTLNEPGLVWEYCNGGVLTASRGELAHGAFEHGFEEIWRRHSASPKGHRRSLSRLSARYPPWQRRRNAQCTFHKLDFAAVANAATRTARRESHAGSTDTGQNLRRSTDREPRNFRAFRLM